jgi:hypothetical protein
MNAKSPRRVIYSAARECRVPWSDGEEQGRGQEGIVRLGRVQRGRAVQRILQAAELSADRRAIRRRRRRVTITAGRDGRCSRRTAVRPIVEAEQGRRRSHGDGVGGGTEAQGEILASTRMRMSAISMNAIEYLTRRQWSDRSGTPHAARTRGVWQLALTLVCSRRSSRVVIAHPQPYTLEIKQDLERGTAL